MSIFDLLDSIGGFFTSLVGIIGQILSSTVAFINTLFQLPAYMESVFSYFPAAIVGGFSGVLILLIALRVLGRD